MLLQASATVFYRASLSESRNLQTFSSSIWEEKWPMLCYLKLCVCFGSLQRVYWHGMWIREHYSSFVIGWSISNLINRNNFIVGPAGSDLQFCRVAKHQWGYELHLWLSLYSLFSGPVVLVSRVLKEPIVGTVICVVSCVRWAPIYYCPVMKALGNLSVSRARQKPTWTKWTMKKNVFLANDVIRPRLLCRNARQPRIANVTVRLVNSSNRPFSTVRIVKNAIKEREWCLVARGILTQSVRRAWRGVHSRTMRQKQSAVSLVPSAEAWWQRKRHAMYHGTPYARGWMRQRQRQHEQL